MKRFRRDEPLVIGAAPRAVLLPPEVAAARSWRKLRAGLGLAAAVVILISAALVVQAYSAESRSASRLATSQTASQRLLVQAQGYSSVSELQAHISEATAAQDSVTADWVDWRKVLRRVEKALPTGTCLTSFTVSLSGTSSSSTSSTSSAPAGTVATVSLGGATDQLQDVQSWISALSSVPGYLNADPGSVSSDTTGSLTVAVSLYLGSKVYSSRAEATPVPVSGTSSTAVDETLPAACGVASATPTPTPTPTPVPTVTVTVPAAVAATDGTDSAGTTK